MGVEPLAPSWRPRLQGICHCSELDDVEPVMPEDVVTRRIYEIDLVEGPIVISKAISRCRRGNHMCRLADNTLADVALMFSKMSKEMM